MNAEDSGSDFRARVSLQVPNRLSPQFPFNSVLFTPSSVLLFQPCLDIEIQSELPRMGAEPDGIDLMLSLVLQPGLDHVLGEHVSL